MKQFDSESLDSQGRKCAGTFEAEDEESARQMLKAQGYQVISIRESISLPPEPEPAPVYRKRVSLSPQIKKYMTLALGIVMGITALFLAVNILRSDAFVYKPRRPGEVRVPAAKMPALEGGSKPASVTAEQSPSVNSTEGAAVNAADDARDTVIGVLQEARDKGVIEEADFQDRRRDLQAMKKTQS